MIRLTGMNSGLDTDSMVKELVNAYEKKGQKTKNAKTKHEWKTEIWTGLNKKIKAFNSKVKSMQFSTSYSAKKTTSSNENKVSVVAKENAVKGTQTITVDQLAKTSYITSKKLELKGADGNTIDGKVTSNTKFSELGFEDAAHTITVKQGDKSVTLDTNADTTVGEFVSKLKAFGLDASFDENNGRFFISAKESGEKNDITFSSDNPAVLDKLGLTAKSGASVIKGEDAIIHLNGAEFKSSSNSFDINGLAINVKGLSDGEQITLTTDTDTDAIYNNIKSIVSEYSKLINELSKLYNADSARKFDPLTDEEKDAMTDDEVEKWETKIKDSLLRRDSNIASVMSAMKNSAMDTYVVGEKKDKDGNIVVPGTKMTLADFGIGTLSYFASGDNEKSALHIFGDADDSDVSGETNKLKAAIAANPDSVADFFSQLMTNMSEQFNKLTTSTTNRSYGNFYDDKKVKSEMTAYEKKVSDFETYLADIEDKYYKQFTAMEKAMAKLNSTQSQLGSYFGQ